MQVIVEREISTYMKEKYSFWFNDSAETLFLDTYQILERKTKRHKFKATKQYSRLDGRSNTIDFEDIELSDYIKKQALNEFTSRIKIEKWK